jgi:hypothetical protein
VLALASLLLGRTDFKWMGWPPPRLDPDLETAKRLLHECPGVVWYAPTLFHSVSASTLHRIEEFLIVYRHAAERERIAPAIFADQGVGVQNLSRRLLRNFARQVRS